MIKGTEAALRDSESEELSAFQVDWQEHAQSSAKWQSKWRSIPSSGTQYGLHEKFTIHHHHHYHQPSYMYTSQR